MNLVALEQMNDFLDHTLTRDWIGRQNSKDGHYQINKLPSLSEYIKKTTMLQSLECYNPQAQCIIMDLKMPMMVLDTPKVSGDSLPNTDLPAIRLHKINSKFEKHLNMQFNRIVDQVKNFVNTDHSMKEYK